MIVLGFLCLLTATIVAVPAFGQAPTFAQQAPTIDGSDDDDVWRATSPITEFRRES